MFSDVPGIPARKADTLRRRPLSRHRDPVAFDGATDVGRASIMPCSIVPIINRFIDLSRVAKFSPGYLVFLPEFQHSSLLCTVKADDVYLYIVLLCADCPYARRQVDINCQVNINY